MRHLKPAILLVAIVLGSISSSLTLSGCNSSPTSDGNDTIAPVIAYKHASLTAYKGIPITPDTLLSAGGSVTGYTVSPALPLGLSLNTSSGLISGTPQLATAAVSDTITAKGHVGLGTTVVTITVLDTSTADVNNSNTAAAIATANLNSAINQLSNSQFQYGKSNTDSLTLANAEFQSALQYNPNNSQANLGAALTGVLLAAQAPGLSAQINNTVGAGSPLNMAAATEAPSERAEILRKVAAQASTPEFHAIQDSVATILLPALEKAIAELQVVYNDPSFSMTLQIDGSARLLGHPEVAVLLAGFKATDALSTLLLSYDIDINDSNGSYAYLDTLANTPDISSNFSNLSIGERAAYNTLAGLLAPTSPFLAVRSGWQTKLAGVDGEIQDALNILQAGLATVRNENAGQSNEILRLCSQTQSDNCIEDEDFNSALAALDTASKYMSQPYAVTVGQGSSVGDTVIHVNYAAFFDVQDYKKIMPYYKFYNASLWDSAHPVLYFTNASGAYTGNVDSLGSILNNPNNLTPAQEIALLKGVIYWQDPTFQGFLPGATSDNIWNLLLKDLQIGQSSSGTSSTENPDYPYSPYTATSGKLTASALMSPNFALSLLGK